MLIWLMLSSASMSSAGGVEGVLIVWQKTTSTRDSHRAVEEWLRADHAASSTPIRLSSEMPMILTAAEVGGLRAGEELVVLGACAMSAADSALASVRSVAPRVYPITSELPEDLLGTCPQSISRPVASFLRALEEDAAAAARAERARATVGACSVSVDDLRRRHGPDALCLGLWGIACAEYSRVAAGLRAISGDRCSFLLDESEPRVSLRIQQGELHLDLCVSHAGQAWVFAGDPATPIDLHCAGEDRAVGGEPRAVGAAVCLELSPEEPHRHLRCYVGSGRVFKVFLGPLGEIRIVESTLCVVRGATDRATVTFLDGDALDGPWLPLCDGGVP